MRSCLFLTRDLRFQLYESIQSYHLQCRKQALRSSGIQKMCNRRSVFLAKEFGIDDFPPISEHKDRVGQGLYMFQIDIG